MRHIKTRGGLYRVGFTCLLLATVCLTLGVLCPGWIRHKAGGTTRYGGLFLTCRDGVMSCQTVDLQRFPERLRATQCLAVLGLTCLVLGSVFAVLDNVWPASHMTSSSARSQAILPDLLTLTGAISTFVGVMVYVSEYDVIVKTPGVDYGYSMILSLIASLVAGGAAVLIFLGNRASPSGGQDARHVHPDADGGLQGRSRTNSDMMPQTAPRRECLAVDSSTMPTSSA